MLKQTHDNLEKLKIPVWLWMTFGDHLSPIMILSAILDGSHY